MSAETIDVPETYLKSVYDRVIDNEYVQMAKNHYLTTKNSCSIAQHTLGTAEYVAVGAANRAFPLYTHYYVPAEAQITSFYSKSKEDLTRRQTQLLHSGVEGTHLVMTKAKNAAVVTGTMSLGAAVVATQMTLALGLAGTNVLLDSVIATKKAGGNMVTSVVATEQAIQKRIFVMLENAQRIAMIPVEKASEHANSLLDVANGIVDRFLGAPAEVEVPNSSVKDRVVRLSKRIIGVISQRAQHDLVDPLQRQIFTTLDSLSKNIDLMEMVRQQQTWAVEKAEVISNTLAESRQWIENEARKLKVSPEEVLLRQIKKSSNSLSHRLAELKTKGTEIVGEDTASRIDTAVDYFQGLDATFAEANNIYQVRDDLITETRHRLSDLSAWTSSWLVRNESASHEPESESEN
ncbi:hypothetical protein QR680_008447 [Steinernema hermaphroditum]|uniref:Perilipin n=1 Tax=Steinernema hermaphroditum TaxID=289476 RepID=A0AA39IIV6_9BILA|nr:hypothetical protein QR680_008447 [Steinernema hermaphroditum]